MVSLHVDVQVVHAGGVERSSCWYSLAFRKSRFAGQSQMKLKGPTPLYNFSKLVRGTLPGYFDLMPYEYGAASLSKASSECLDLAYLNAVWRYSHKVGRKHFPVGIFE